MIKIWPRGRAWPQARVRPSNLMVLECLKRFCLWSERSVFVCVYGLWVTWQNNVSRQVTLMCRWVCVCVVYLYSFDCLNARVGLSSWHFLIVYLLLRILVLVSLRVCLSVCVTYNFVFWLLCFCLSVCVCVFVCYQDHGVIWQTEE